MARCDVVPGVVSTYRMSTAVRETLPHIGIAPLVDLRVAFESRYTDHRAIEWPVTKVSRAARTGDKVTA